MSTTFADEQGVWELDTAPVAIKNGTEPPVKVYVRDGDDLYASEILPRVAQLFQLRHNSTISMRYFNQYVRFLNDALLPK